MKGRSFAVYGIIAVVVAITVFLVLESTTSWPWFWNWIIAASGITFLYYGYDKASSKMGTGRIPELLLHFLALGGGFIGAILGMLLFRHKTNFREHPLFVPIILLAGALWGFLIYWLLTRG